VQVQRILRLPFDVKLDLFVLLSGVDVRKEQNIMKNVAKMSEYRNDLLHGEQWKSLLYAERFLQEIDESITATRTFFRFITKAFGYLPTTYGFLDDDRPFDMVSRGYRFISLGTTKRQSNQRTGSRAPRP